MQSLTASALLALAILLLWRFTRPSTNSPLPPGPPAHPWIGHLLKLPAVHQELVFHKWAKLYGEITYIHIIGSPIVILNTAKAAFDLLEGRGSIYSDRPNFVMYVDLLGFTSFLAVLRYGNPFKKHRRMLEKSFNRQASRTFQDIYTKEARLLIKNLVDKPKDFDWLARRFATAVIMRISFGHHIKADDDIYIKMAENFTNVLESAGNAGTTPPDLFPILKNLPPWFPGARFARFAHDARPVVRKLYDHPFNEVRKQMDAGTAENSFLSQQLESLLQNGGTVDDFEDLKGAATSVYAGGAETTWSSVVTIILAMVSFPEWFKCAQEEVDTVVGSGRLPELNDRESLPFVECVHQEIYRWHPIAPLGMPHRSTEDDIYKGMFIPKGSLVLGNVTSISLDENVYAEPHKFNPARYLPKPQGNGEPHPSGIFGFGRRICPGRHLGDSSVWTVLVTMVATLRVTKAIGEDGKEITPEIAFTSGLTSHPEPFKCMIRPRNEKALSLVQDAIADC